jgi:hypothetical protein
MEETMPAAWSNGQWIWLDLAANRYKGGVDDNDAALRMNQAAKVARLRAAGSGQRRLVPPASVLKHYLGCAWIARRVRTSTIRDQLYTLKTATSIRVDGAADVEDMAWLYQHIRNLRPHRPACLEDSLCCALFMQRYIGRASFCIGVKQPPFMAHAWVQIGDLIINDTKSVVEAYSEILRLDL